MYVLTSTVCFIGMPGTGKSTLSKQIANHFDLPFMDLDESLEHHQGKSIAALWQSDGEASFRILERFHLIKALSGPPIVLSAGGGTPCFFDNMSLINAFSFSIYLKLDHPNAMNELFQGTHPVFNETEDPKEQWIKLLHRRTSFYESAHFIQDAYKVEPNVFKAVSNFCLHRGIITSNSD